MRTRHTLSPQPLLRGIAACALAMAPAIGAPAFAQAIALEPGKLSLRTGEADALFRAPRLADAAAA